MSDTTSEPLSYTPLRDLHVAAGARMVPFAGYEMPVQYEGIIAEHQWTRRRAGLFDVSHMGQARLDGPDHATIATALETLCAADIANLGKGRQRYTQLLNDEVTAPNSLISCTWSRGLDDATLDGAGP